MKYLHRRLGYGRMVSSPSWGDSGDGSGGMEGLRYYIHKFRGYRAGYMVASHDYYSGCGMCKLEHNSNDSIYECGFIDGYNDFLTTHKEE